MRKNVMFSGGIPAADTAAVFTLLAQTAGDRALSWPDGETNLERSGWIGAINRHVLAKAPCFEQVAPDPGQPQDERSQALASLRIRDGATVDLRGRLPYARDAIASYATFTRMKAEGTIPPDTRFQVAIPGAHDVISISFTDPAEWPVLFAAWQQAVAQEWQAILEVIPAEELCAQIDYCTEMIHIGGAWAQLLDWVPDLPAEDLFAQYTSPEYIRSHLAGLPDQVRVGFHICCGTWPTYPVQPLEDITLPVRLANAIQQASGGRVDYVHLPAMQDSGAQYFAPLADLDTGEATVYLGLECNDGLEAMTRRIAAAQRYLPEFGVAHYCGYSWNREVMPELLATLAEGADLLNT